MITTSRRRDVLGACGVAVLGLPILAAGGLGLAFELGRQQRLPTLVAMSILAAVGFVLTALAARLAAGGPPRRLFSPAMLMTAGAMAGAFGYLAPITGPAPGTRGALPLWLLAAALSSLGLVGAWAKPSQGSS